MATREPATAPASEQHFCELSLEEGLTLLDREAQRYLQMSGEDFIRRWDTGEFKNVDRRDVLRVASHLPFAR